MSGVFQAYFLFVSFFIGTLHIDGKSDDHGKTLFKQKLVGEGQEILKRYGIEPIIGTENLVWAPNRITGQHGIECL
ncbi:hypothetical protein [Bacillus cereus]|uniref:hypothetical protein n=1 Tax=Bacillus cereus TaxID=1396 RepID=UPI00397F34BC